MIVAPDKLAASFKIFFMRSRSSRISELQFSKSNRICVPRDFNINVPKGWS